MHGNRRLESAECAWFPAAKNALPSIEPARRQLVLVPAEVVAELVQVGEARLLVERLHVPVGKVPEAFQIEQDLRRRRVGLGDFRAEGVAGEQPEDVGLEPLGQNVGIGPGKVMHRHGAGERADFRREPALRGPDGVGGEFGQAGEVHSTGGEGTEARLAPNGATGKPGKKTRNPSRHAASWLSINMKTSFKLSTLFVLAALVSAPFALATDPAPAAPPAPDAGARPHPMMRHMMQRRLEFLTEKLNLTEDQRTKIKAIWKQSAGQVKALRDEASLAREDLRAKADAMRKANRDQVRAVLTPEQQAIFDQLPADGPGRPGGKKDNDS